MARPRKTGLDYFPMDVDFFSDIRIRKLIRYQSGNAIAVYALLLCIIYRDGYYIRWDEELPFIISEQTGYKEAYIREVIKCCLNIGLFSRELYDSEKILTSRGIQSRYMSARALSRLPNKIEEFALVSSEKTPVSSEKTSVSSEKTPQIKEKEKKENKIKPSQNECAQARGEREILIEKIFNSGIGARHCELLKLDRDQYTAAAVKVMEEWEANGTPHTSWEDMLRHLFNHIRCKVAATPNFRSAPTKAAIQQARREKEERRQKAAEEERRYRESVEETGMNGWQQYCAKEGLPDDTKAADVAPPSQSEYAALREFRDRMNNNP